MRVLRNITTIFKNILDFSLYVKYRMVIRWWFSRSRRQIDKVFQDEFDPALDLNAIMMSYMTDTERREYLNIIERWRWAAHQQDIGWPVAGLPKRFEVM